MIKSQFKPSQFQPDLPVNKLIREINNNETLDLEFDVAFVGGGPAGLAGAIELSRLIKKDNESVYGLGSVEIGVIEKASQLGGHTLSGAVIDPVSLKMLFPDLHDTEFPFRRPVTEEKVFLLTKSYAISVPVPPTMKNHGKYVASLCELVRWMGAKAEEAGVNILTAVAAESLLIKGRRVSGFSTVASGLDRDGKPSERYLPSTKIGAQVTVLAEGTRGQLTQAYLQWEGIKSRAAQTYALGVKEIWRVKNNTNSVMHTLGWPLPKNAFGGSFLYPMSDDTLALGLVVGLDYRQSNLDVHKLLQQLKKHPHFENILSSGECIEWGAKTIPEGGFDAIPERLYGDGVLILGDSAGLVNVPALKGVHYAIASGIFAARAIFNFLKTKNKSGSNLADYQDQLQKSFVYSDLEKVRNFRPVFKGGFFAGGFKASLMSMTNGSFPQSGLIELPDSEEFKTFFPADTSNKGLSKEDAVYLSGNKTRDTIPNHITVGQGVTGELADFYSAMCPAGVYSRSGEKLIISPSNCVDCKATDILGPRWSPREGGSGPNYKEM